MGFVVIFDWKSVKYMQLFRDVQEKFECAGKVRGNRQPQ
jgi:hypothetical protein